MHVMLIKKDIPMVRGARSVIGWSSRVMQDHVLKFEGGEVRLLNEDEILATVQDPTDILHKY
jgi:hypothetical protein